MSPCRICRCREPAGDDGLCDPCAHFRWVQALVQGRALPAWHTGAAASLLQGVEALARGDPPPQGRSRSRTRSPGAGSPEPPHSKGRGKGKGQSWQWDRRKGNGKGRSDEDLALAREAARAAADAAVAAMRGR
ncbi:unnamed protein product [Symbiodinium natans]|uniref:Uncharacterized protein n=1 Tax=Symbiodinium natans TaxID=878477 RepID=A0A812QSA3_9DINO|nr:unnamed protein product [Symbiodinium natans]